MRAEIIGPGAKADPENPGMPKKTSSEPKKGFLAVSAAAVRALFGRDTLPDSRELADWGVEGEVASTTPSAGAKDALRSRRDIYNEWEMMLRNPLVGSAIGLHVTAALGGHETSGDVVFIEERPGISEDDKRHVEAVRNDLQKMLNAVAPTVGTGLAGLGDAYCRLYQREGQGIVGIVADELLSAPLVQPWEQGGVTRLCSVSVGTGRPVRLTMDRIARFKMPRTTPTPQALASEKHRRQNLEEDDPDKLPLSPGLAGGSMLSGAEEAYRNFAMSMSAMNSQRLIDSIDESIIMAHVPGMTVEQRKRFGANLRRVLEKSRDLVAEVVKTGRPVLQRIRHIIPVFAEKQLIAMQSTSGAGGGGGRVGQVSIEDVMLNAKILAGKLGTDITMLGWADQLTGGWGDGGAFRMSAQTAERSRALRVALDEGFRHIIDVHSRLKYGRAYEPGKEPWALNFYGTISALESERQRTKAEAVNASALVVQTFAGLRDSGLSTKSMVTFMSKQLLLDEDEAKQYAADLEKSAKAAADAASGGLGGDGFGGPNPPEPSVGGEGDGAYAGAGADDGEGA